MPAPQVVGTGHAGSVEWRIPIALVLEKAKAGWVGRLDAGQGSVVPLSVFSYLRDGRCVCWPLMRVDACHKDSVGASRCRDDR